MLKFVNLHNNNNNDNLVAWCQQQRNQMHNRCPLKSLSIMAELHGPRPLRMFSGQLDYYVTCTTARCHCLLVVGLASGIRLLFRIVVCFQLSHSSVVVIPCEEVHTHTHTQS